MNEDQISMFKEVASNILLKSTSLNFDRPLGGVEVTRRYNFFEAMIVSLKI